MIGSSVLLTYQSIETASTNVESNERLYNGDSEKQEYCSPNVPRVQQLKELHHVGLLICSGTSTLNIVHAVCCRVGLLLLPNLRGSTGHKESLKTKIRWSARAVMAMATGKSDSQDVSIIQPTRLGRLNMVTP